VREGSLQSEEEESKGDEVDVAVAGFELEWSAGLAA
jgi:hypothetical protein